VVAGDRRVAAQQGRVAGAAGAAGGPRQGHEVAQDGVIDVLEPRDVDARDAALVPAEPVEEEKRVGALGQAVEGQLAVAGDRGTPHDRVDAGDLPEGSSIASPWSRCRALGSEATHSCAERSPTRGSTGAGERDLGHARPISGTGVTSGRPAR